MLKRMTRFGLLAVLFAGLAFTQTACGKKGNLKPPSGQHKPGLPNIGLGPFDKPQTYWQLFKRLSD